MAKASIYDDALFVGQWAGYDVYEPIFNDGEVHYTGFPQYILAKDGALRWTDNSGVMNCSY
jgi:hypothetical protein